MNKKILLGLCLILLLVLTSCNGGRFGPRINQGIPTTNFFDGTQGIDAEYLDQAPPREVFETSEFDVQLFVHNRGAFSVEEQYAVVVDLTYDSSKVERITNYQLEDEEVNSPFDIIGLNNIFVNDGPSNQIIGEFTIEGKNPDWRQGEQKYVSLGRFRAREIPGRFQTNTATFIAQLCYPYQTSFASEVCIDTDTQGTSERVEVCEKRDYSYSGGQGAPIAITAVESQMIPRGVYVQPQFTIHIKSMGDGVISYRDVKSQTYSAALCERVDPESINKISAEVFLGGDELNCLPNEIILKDGEAKIQCQLTENNILGVSSNYETSLQVRLGYQYLESFKEDVIVLKSEATNFENLQTSDPDGCFDWQTLNQNHPSGRATCVNSCDFLAENQNNLEAFSSLQRVVNVQLADGYEADYLWEQVGCIYRGSSVCNDNPELCILENGLCPPGDYCGMPSCLLRNTPPAITDRLRIGASDLVFSCSDGDDVNNLQQTCGCTETAYFGLIPKNESCVWPSSYTQQSQGDRNNVFGIKHTIPNLISEANRDNKLCILVRDKLNANSTLELRYPFS